MYNYLYYTLVQNGDIYTLEMVFTLMKLSDPWEQGVLQQERRAVVGGAVCNHLALDTVQ